VEELLGQLAREAARRYYGKYRGFVADTDDPKRQGRLRLRIPSVLGDAVSSWAEAVLPFGGLADMGLLAIPEVDALVWVEFVEGDLSHPLWTGTAFVPASGGSPKLGDPNVRAFRTSAGQLLALEDTDQGSQLRIEHPTGATVTIDDRGTIELTAADGTSMTLDADAGEIRAQDANGNSVSTSAAGITVQGQTVNVQAEQVSLGNAVGQPVILAETFLTGYLAHTHLIVAPVPGTPTGPPIPTTEPASMSLQVTAS
jgi:uncharacterized protein involved in type VI secretion and phage assembly